ncbi:hypothetical protein Hte_010538 [Hypoxylon texense]
MVRFLDGTNHRALFATPGSGVIYQGKEWTIDADDTDLDYDQLYTICFSARDELLAAIRSYCEKRKLPALDLETNNNWNTVEESLTVACEALEAFAKKDKTLNGIPGRLKGAYLKLCKHAGVGDTLCSLIPEQFMCAPTLRGGLKMIFVALEQSHSYDEEVCRALEDIPFIINRHVPYMEMYRKNKDLHIFNASLHASIFRLLQLLLLWFTESRAVATMKIGLNPKRFLDRLKERIADVRAAESRFEKHTSLLESRENRDFHQRATTSLQSFERGLFIEGLDRKDVLDKFMITLQQRQGAWESNAMEVFRSILYNPWQALVEAESARKRILTGYGYNSMLALNHCALLSNVRGRFEGLHLDSDRINAIRTNPRMLAWLAIDGSSMLLVDGNTERSTNNEASFVAARIVEGAFDLLEQDQSNLKVIPLAFFCGCHRFDTTPQLAMNLLLALVDLYRGFDVITLQECIEGIDDRDLMSIIDLLEKLIWRLPSGVVVLLVIDGLRCFSQPRARSQEMHEFMARLVEIYRKNPPATLKFLFTNAPKSNLMRGLLPDNEIVHIPRNLPSRGGQGRSTWSSKIDFTGI